MRNRMAQPDSASGIVECRDRRPRRGRQRKRAKVDPRDHAERPERADHQLVQVVARDIFHHAPAAFRRGAIASDEFDAENVVARGAVKLPQRRIDAGRNRAADGRAIHERHDERKKLPMFRERAFDALQRNSGLDAERQIAGIVCNHAIEARQIEREIVLPRRRSHVEFGARAARNDRQLLGRRKFHNLADLRR